MSNPQPQSQTQHSHEAALKKAIEDYARAAHPSKATAMPPWLVPLIMKIIMEIMAAIGGGTP